MNIKPIKHIFQPKSGVNSKTCGQHCIAMATGVLFGVNKILDKMGDENTMFANPSVDLSVVFIALLILVGSGILAGFIPAQTAINIKPVDALRTE